MKGFDEPVTYLLESMESDVHPSYGLTILNVDTIKSYAQHVLMLVPSLFNKYRFWNQKCLDPPDKTGAELTESGIAICRQGSVYTDCKSTIWAAYFDYCVGLRSSSANI